MSDDVAGRSWLRSRSVCVLFMAILAAIGMSLFMVSWANASLPDSRSWEMVSPLDKNGGDVVGIEGDNGGGVVQAAADGQAITYVSFASFADPQAAPAGSQYVASRDIERGWTSLNISLPTSSQTVHFGGAGIPYTAFSPNLSRGLVFGGSRGGSDFSRPVESPPLAGAPAGYENYYLNEIPSGELQPLLTQTPSVLPGAFGLDFIGSDPDLAHVVVRSSAALGANPDEEPGNSNLYEWEKITGGFWLVNILPDGTPETTFPVALGSGPGTQDRAISDDGSRVIWTGGPALYVREGIGTEQARTVQADGPDGEGTFLTASSNGSKIFFADRNGLTADSTAIGGGLGDLYRFVPDAAEGARLVDLTVDHVDSGGAEVQGVLGASKDGSYLYFVANGVLAPGASPGDCSPGSPLPSRTCNLYLWHEGEGSRFIARLSGNDERNTIFNSLGVAFDWSTRVGKRTARVSDDGLSVAFMSERALTGYDNTVSVGSSCATDVSGNPLPAACEEVFLYEATGAGHLSCVSCNPNGVRPIGPSSIPGGTNFRLVTGQYQSRALSDGIAGGRVFFDSEDALVPQDSNGREDVYEYEVGQVYLLSGGRSAGRASFVDASISGDDVFFITRAPLVDKDKDQLVDLYDARVPHVPGEAVGFPTPPATASCNGEDCRPAGPTSPENTPLSSFVFSDLGNVLPSSSKPTVKPKKKIKPKKVKPKKHKRKVKHGRKAKAGRSDDGSTGGRG